MRRVGIALCLAVVAAGAPAEASDHRHKTAADKPGAATATLQWFAAPARSNPSATRASTPASPAPVTRAARPRAVTVALTPAEAPAAAPPTPALAAPAVLPVERPRVSHGRVSSCTEGQRIITAYYVDGRRTANGERFDPNGMTAAHRTLPFGTHLKVINPRNGKVVTVRVNDRGPFVRGVTLDLSRGAAQAIGLSGTGAVCMAQM